MADFTNLKKGLSGRANVTVADAHSALRLGSGAIAVYATPMMIALMEQAAVACVEHLLPDGFNSLGTRLDVAHVAATPIGIAVTATAELVAVDGRTLTFRVEARDAKEQIGVGTHTRVVVERSRFEDKMAAKALVGS